MGIARKSTLWRGQKACAKKTLITRIWKSVSKRWRTRKHPHVRDLDAHLARDIGLIDADLARHRHIWPSQSPPYQPR